MGMRHSFELLHEQPIPELASHAWIYHHTRTGAKLLALTNDDPNKTFGVAFPIASADDTGVAHILEHCMFAGGSRRYPVKELPVELLKGSLATFFNGIMAFDKTIYVCASQHLQDFYNLMEVSIDVTLHPRLPRHAFEQEGWHYELESLDAPLSYNGVVMNEAKGGYGTADAVLFTESLRALFPDTVYGRYVGGHPRHIPDLSYEQMKAFHAAHYHPSNAHVFLYGDFPLEDCLRRLDSQLQEFDRVPTSPPVALQPGFAAPRTVTVPYPAEGANQKAHVTLNWVLADNDDPARVLALEVLREALVGSPAAPLNRALLDSGLGKDLAQPLEWLSMTGGLSEWSQLRQLVFTTGLKDVAPEDAGRALPLILDTLGNLADKGLAPDALDAAFNAVEFRLRETYTGGWLEGQRGFALLLRAMATWTHGGDPLALLAFDAPLAAVKKQAADPRYFGELIRSYLLENPHRATLYAEPDPGFRQREEAAERKRLEQARAAMSASELQAVLERTRVLKQPQETPESARTALPTLRRTDLDRESPRIPLELGEEAQTRLLYHPLRTNGIVYLDLGFDLRALSQDELPYAVVFGRALLELGTRAQDAAQLGRRIGRFTGGIRPQLLARPGYGGAPDPVWLFMRAKATVEKAGELFAILREVLLTVDLDRQERVLQLVLQEQARREAALHRALSRRLRAHWGDAGWADDQLTGLGSLFFLRQLAEEVKADWPAVRARLEAVRAALVNRNAMLANLTLDPAAWPRVRAALATLLSGLPVAPAGRSHWTRLPLAVNEGFTIPSQVNYVGKGAILFELGYTLHGSALAIT